MTLTDLANLSPTYLAIIFVAFIVLFVLLPSLLVAFMRTQQRRIAAEKGLQQLGKCPLCGGELETGRVVGSMYRSGWWRRQRPVGAVRCTNCGNTMLFS